MNDEEPKRGRKATPEMNRALQERMEKARQQEREASESEVMKPSLRFAKLNQQTRFARSAKLGEASMEVMREFAKAAQEKGPQPSKRARMPDPGVQNKTPQERSDKASEWPAEDRVLELFLKDREEGKPLVTWEQLQALKPTKH